MKRSPETIRVYNQEYYKKHKEYLLQKTREYRMNNKEKIKENKRIKYYQTRDKQLDIKKKNYYSNRGERLREKKEYYLINRELVKGKVKEYRKDNPERTEFTHMVQFHKKRSQANKLLTFGEWQRTKKHFNNSCAYCGSDFRLGHDHYIPIINGGEFTKENILPCCRFCNSSKFNKNFIDWYKKQPFFDLERVIRIYETTKDKKILEMINASKGMIEEADYIINSIIKSHK